MNKGKLLVITSLSLMVMFIDMGRAEDPWDMPFDQVFEPDVKYPNIALEMRVVDDADAECRKYAPDINFVMKHCALQYTPRDGIRKCVIVMDKDSVTMGDLGHELRHCFEGDWHIARPTKGVKRR